MKEKKISKQITEDKLTPKIFSAPLLIIAELLFIIGAVCALLSLAHLGVPSHKSEIYYGIAAQNILESGVMETWFYIIVIGKALFALFAITFACGLGVVIISAARAKGEPCKVKGLGFIGAMNTVAIWIWVGLLALAALVFAYKITVYTVALLSEVVDFVFPLMAVTVGELVMVLMIVGITALLIVFWRGLSFLAYHIRYMLYTERTDSHIEPVSYVGLFVLSAFCIYLVDFFYYDPISIVEFAALGIATLLLGICVRILKKRVEWIHFLNYEREEEIKRAMAERKEQ